MLQIRNLTKQFGALRVLQPTNLKLEKGQTTVLLGPSGCGKSTLLRLIVGLLPMDSGEILFDGNPLTPENIRDYRRRMGYMIQDGGLFPHLTVRGNAELLAKRLGWPRDRREARLRELTELTDLPHEALDRYPVQISGGQRQRVALIRALFMDPDVVLLDEPMGALDPLIRSDLQTELKRIFSELQKTVILVTHDIGEAGYLGDTIVLFQSGEIIQQGSLEDLVRRPVAPFVSEFINAQRSPLEGVA
ncbi:MAG: ATP-binding cassette domain-containing protein [Pirellulaceae bacterium]|nr:ATP-binding cassette domain-containing protein [Planctomycetales bacterium]